MLGVAIFVGVLLLSLGTAQAIRASVPGSRGPSLEFVAGLDSSSVCTSFPCGHVSVSEEGASVSMSLGIESSERLQAATYYTDLLRVVNPTGENLTIASVAVTGISYTRSGDLGGMTIYYCQQQTDDPANGCQGSFTISSNAGGTVFSGPDTLGPGSAVFIEFAGYAGAGAQPGDTISFGLEVSSQ